jgi:septal ring-binding cell division protein DamX
VATSTPNQRWHAVLIGSYGTRAAAADAFQRLPDRLRRLDPTIRALAPDMRLEPIRPPTER